MTNQPSEVESKPMVVKVQVPSFTNHPDPPILVYNRDRSFETQWPASQFSEPVLAEMRERRLSKAYFEMTRANGECTFGKMVKEQSW